MGRGPYRVSLLGDRTTTHRMAIWPPPTRHILHVLTVWPTHHKADVIREDDLVAVSNRLGREVMGDVDHAPRVAGIQDRAGLIPLPLVHMLHTERLDLKPDNPGQVGLGVLMVENRIAEMVVEEELDVVLALGTGKAWHRQRICMGQAPPNMRESDTPQESQHLAEELGHALHTPCFYSSKCMHGMPMLSHAWQGPADLERGPEPDGVPSLIGLDQGSSPLVLAHLDHGNRKVVQDPVWCTDKVMGHQRPRMGSI